MTTDKLSKHIVLSLLALRTTLFSVFGSLCLTDHIQEDDMLARKRRVAMKDKISESEKTKKHTNGKSENQKRNKSSDKAN